MVILYMPSVRLRLLLFVKPKLIWQKLILNGSKIFSKFKKNKMLSYLQ